MTVLTPVGVLFYLLCVRQMLLRVAIEVNQGGVVGTEVEVGNVSSYNLWPLQVSEHCLMKLDRNAKWPPRNYESRLSSYGIVSWHTLCRSFFTAEG